MRKSHGQALEAWQTWKVAELEIETSTLHYADVALVIAMLRDSQLLKIFLSRELGALANDGIREADLRVVIRACLENVQNAVATASALGCSRRTVERKLRRAESVIGHPLRQRSAEVLLALRLARRASAGAPVADGANRQAELTPPEAHGGTALGWGARCTVKRHAATWRADWHALALAIAPT